MRHTKKYSERKAELKKIEIITGKIVAERLLHDTPNTVVCGYITYRLELFAQDCVDDTETTHREMLQLIAYADNVECEWYGILGQELPR